MMFAIAYINNPEEAVTGRENREIRVPLRKQCAAQYTHKKPPPYQYTKKDPPDCTKMQSGGFRS